MVRARLRKHVISGYAHLVPYLLVLGLSLLVGAAVYLATVRTEHDTPALGFGDDLADAGAAPAAGTGYAYLRVSTEEPSIRDRLQGLIGAIVLVSLGAAALAFAIYQGGHLIDLMIKSFLGS
jgi:hypothetical protein